MLDGSLKSVLNNKKITEALKENSIEKLSGKRRIYAVSDHCDIRKKYSSKLEDIGQVRDLDGKIINGYYSIATIFVDENRRDITFADIDVFSNKEYSFVSQENLKKYEKDKLLDDEKAKIRELVESDSYINKKKSIENQLTNINGSFKEQSPKTRICYIHDSACDDSNYFKFINKELKQEFVVRLKKSRNSNQTKIDVKGKEKKIKLIDAKFESKGELTIDKIKIKNRLFQQLKVIVEWNSLKIDEDEYNAVRVTLKDRNGDKIYKEPIMLLTNIGISNFTQAMEIYRIYMLRSKIESVFKFLKDVLGLEEFRVREFETIKNIISLCFFIGGYFYEIEDILTKDKTIQLICKLGNGKGKVTRYFFLKGLEKLLIAKDVENFIDEFNISDETYQKMLDYAGVSNDL